MDPFFARTNATYRAILDGTNFVNFIRQIDYNKAENRLVREFVSDFCKEDGYIYWKKRVEFNSGD